MGYVVYRKHDTRKMFTKTFKTEAAAKAALTRFLKRDDQQLAERDWYAIADTLVFENEIEQMVERTNLLSGKKYMERANTPLSCSPSSETYWSM